MWTLLKQSFFFWYVTGLFWFGKSIGDSRRFFIVFFFLPSKILHPRNLPAWTVRIVCLLFSHAWSDYLWAGGFKKADEGRNAVWEAPKNWPQLICWDTCADDIKQPTGGEKSTPFAVTLARLLPARYVAVSEAWLLLVFYAFDMAIFHVDADMFA